MKYVYIIRSISHPDQWYTGRTSEPTFRLGYHNAGKVRHTAKFTPWELVAFVGLREEATAIQFEKYLKSGSGRAFARKHFR